MAWRIVLLSVLGAAPDLDLLIGRHRAESHSIGAAVMAGILAATLRWPLASTRFGIFVAAAGAWGSHIVLDMLGEDTSVPYGVEALWPLTTEFFTAGVDVFSSISRRWYTPRFLQETIAAIVYETLVLVPLLVIVVWAKRQLTSLRASRLCRRGDGRPL
jgi:inner membrane protein